MKLGMLSANALALLIVAQPLGAGVYTPLDNFRFLDHVSHGALNGEINLANYERLARYNTVNFGFDLDVLDREAKRRISRQAAYIRGRKNVKFAVTGHTDKVGNAAYNMDLGLRRANRVLEELVRLGVDRNRLVAMVSMGERDPLVNVETRERLNRRVTTRVLVREDKVASRNTGASAGGSVPVNDTSGGDTSGATSDGDTSSDTASGGTSGDTSGGGTSGETASGGTSADAPSGDTSGDASSGDTSADASSGDTSGDAASSGGSTDDKPDTEEPTTVVSRPGNSAAGTGRPDAGRGNGNEPSGDPAGSIGHNKGGDESGGN